jgi:hypothetical protein
VKEIFIKLIMKKQNPVIYLVILFISIFLNAGCKKDTTTPPVITIYGANPDYVTLNTSYYEEGAIANDATDGDISSKIVTTYYPSTGVNVNQTGTYYAYYNVTDAAGNQAAQQIRTIYVTNTAANYAGYYSESIKVNNIYSYGTDSVIVSSTINNQIIFSNFALNPSANIFANIINNTVIIPQQTIGDTVYWGTGEINTSPHIIFVITYSDSSIISHVTTMNCTSTYSKQ